MNNPTVFVVPEYRCPNTTCPDFDLETHYVRMLSPQRSAAVHYAWHKTEIVPCCQTCSTPLQKEV